MQIDYESEQQSVYNLDLWCGRMCRGLLQRTQQRARTCIVLEEIVRIKCGTVSCPWTLPLGMATCWANPTGN